MAKEETIEQLIRNADGLAERARERLGALSAKPSWGQFFSLSDRKLDCWTFGFAVVGVIITGVGITAALWPLLQISLRYWFG